MIHPGFARSLIAIGLLAFASVASAGPISIQVKSFIVPVAGQTPFVPSPGSFLSDSEFDMTPGTPQTIGSFGGSFDWIESGPTPTSATLVTREYEFIFGAEVTDVSTGAVTTFSYPGRAFAEWVAGVDGGVYAPKVGVTFGTPTKTGPANSASPTFTTTVEPWQSAAQSLVWKGASVVRPDPDNVGAEIALSVSTVQQVPEPGTLLLGLVTVVPLAGTALRRLRLKFGANIG